MKTKYKILDTPCHYLEEDMPDEIDFSDGIICSSPDINAEVMTYARESGKPLLEFQPEEVYIDAYNEFYNKILG